MKSLIETYRDYEIHHGSTVFERYHFHHKDFDGAPIHSESDDCPDHRHGGGNSIEECKYHIDEMVREEIAQEFDDLIDSGKNMIQALKNLNKAINEYGNNQLNK